MTAGRAEQSEAKSDTTKKLGGVMLGFSECLRGLLGPALPLMPRTASL